MKSIRSIVARFPLRELEIRRRCACDPHFKSICADYEEAASALRHWQAAAQEGDRKTEDYADLLVELETEILAHLEGQA